MITNKVVDIKTIFKTYLKILKTCKKHLKFLNRLYSTKHQRTISKTIFEIYFKKQLPNKVIVLRLYWC